MVWLVDKKMDWVKQNWFKVSIILLLVIVIFLLISKKDVSVSELYKINSDCSQEAIDFAKSDSIDGVKITNVQQNFFDVHKGICFAEFTYLDIDGSVVSEIHDLTHGKLIIYNSTFRKGEDIVAYEKNNKDYGDVKRDIFSAQN